MSWAERYFFRAILQYHIHFHARVISQKGVYRAEARAAEAPHLIGSYITPYVRSITFESRKRHHGDSGGSRMAGEATGGQKGRGGGRCWNWNSGRPCVRDPCGFTYTCSVKGCTRPHKAIYHRLDRKWEFVGGAGQGLPHQHAEDVMESGSLPASRENQKLRGSSPREPKLLEAEPKASYAQFLQRHHLLALRG